MNAYLAITIVLVSFGQVAPNQEAATTPESASSGSKAASKPAPRQTVAEKAATNGMARVAALKAELTKPGLAVGAKNRLKKQLAYAQNYTQNAFQAVRAEIAQKEEQAYIDKMTPIWMEQQRQNAQFNIETAKAQALQQMANTAEKKRVDDLWIQWQRNQIMTSEAQSLQQMSRSYGR